MKKLAYTLTLAAMAFVLVATLPSDAAAQWRFGPEVAFADDFEFGIGGRVMTDIDAFGDDEDSALSELRGIGQFLYYLDPVDGCDDCSAWELNVNGAIPLELGESGTDFYVGGGLNIANISVDVGGFGSASSTELGLNALGGLNFALGSMAAFGAVGIRISGSEQFVIGAGLAFGGGGDDMDGGM